MSEPTTKAERETWLKRLGKHTDRLLYGPQTMMGRLIDDVERLEAEPTEAHNNAVLGAAETIRKLTAKNKQLRKANRALARAALDAAP